MNPNESNKFASTHGTTLMSTQPSWAKFTAIAPTKTTSDKPNHSDNARHHAFVLLGADHGAKRPDRSTHADLACLGNGSHRDGQTEEESKEVGKGFTGGWRSSRRHGGRRWGRRSWGSGTPSSRRRRRRLRRLCSGEAEAPEIGERRRAVGVIGLAWTWSS